MIELDYQDIDKLLIGNILKGTPYWDTRFAKNPHWTIVDYNNWHNDAYYKEYVEGPVGDPEMDEIIREFQEGNTCYSRNGEDMSLYFLGMLAHRGLIKDDGRVLIHVCW